MVVNVVEGEEPRRNVKQAIAHHDKAHHRATPERDDKPAVQAADGTVRRTGTRMGRRLHAQETTQAAKEAARKEGHRNKRILDLEEGQHNENEEQGEKHDRHRLVLPSQISVRTHTNIPSNGSHLVGTGWLPYHLLEEIVSHAQGEYGGDRNEKPIAWNRDHVDLILGRCITGKSLELIYHKKFQKKYVF